MPDKIHGVNLGGWLVLEKWIKPSLFAGQSAEDEYSLCLELGKEKAAGRLQEHRETWITADDFKWLAAHGINAVRLPVGYWVAEENPPFLTGLETMDWAFRTAHANGLSVLLDLHGLPGSQNGWDHSGRQGVPGWHTSKANIAHSLRIIEDLASRCKQYENLLGIELVNEPSKEVPLDILKSYYQAGCQCIRRHLGQDQAAVIIHDGFRPFEWDHFLAKPGDGNVVLDTHLYQCFSDQDHRRDINAQIEVAAVERKEQLDKMQKQLPCIVGEWSLGLPPKALEGLDPVGREASMRAFGGAQLVSYERTRGWFFWTYRTEEGGGWSFRDCVNRGWLPGKFGG
ncbi:MAG TPA: glycoside hydrolase family 5 protein [Candidatus Acidoferrum sp.]|nr:glycoside hydrolase family 5 protein [Candidatus Acidoferrum sp.]